MEIDVAKDFERPREEVLECLRDPARIEAVLSDLGAYFERRAVLPEAQWDCQMRWRDATRQLTVTLQEPAINETFALGMTSDLAVATMVMDLYDLPDGGCRIKARADLRAKTIPAKLALNALRLARGRAENRMTRFIAALGRPHV